MMEQFTYPERKSMKWLMSVFLALSCFAFSLSPVSTQAQQQMPSRIEQVVSSKDRSEDELAAFYQVVGVASSFSLTKRSREYEKKILFAYQNTLDVAFKNISEELPSFSVSAFHTFIHIIPQHSDEELSPAII